MAPGTMRVSGRRDFQKRWSFYLGDRNMPTNHAIAKDHLGDGLNRKWLVFAGIVVIEITMFVGLLPWRNFDHIRTTDFINFYAAAQIMRDGHGSTLYSAATQAPVLFSILGRNTHDYFLHPPFFAAAIVPFSYLSIEHAFILWTLLNMLLVGAMPLLLSKCVVFVARKPYFGLVGAIFFPVLTTLTLGQDSILLVFILTMGYLLLSRDKNLFAGLVLSLATIKFQYVFVIVGLLLLKRKYRLFAGFILGCVVLLGISIFTIGVDGLMQYAGFVRDYNAHDGYGAIHLAQMINWRGFFAGMGWMSHLHLLAALGSLFSLSFGIATVSRSTSTENLGTLVSFCVVIAIIISPYAYFQDATLLLLPLYLAMDTVITGRVAGVMRGVTLGACAAVFIWPLILLAFGGHYWWNSRIYLMFPVILCFAVVLAADVRQQ